MNILDIFLILMVLTGVVLGAVFRIFRSGLMLLCFYISALVAAIGYKPLTKLLKYFGSGLKMELLIFVILFVLLFVILMAVMKWAFPDTRFMKLGFLDHLGGAGIGVVVGALFGALLFALLKMWDANFVWQSALGGVFSMVLRIFDYSVMFMFPGGFPTILMPT